MQMRIKPKELWSRYGFWVTLFLLAFLRLRSPDQSSDQAESPSSLFAAAAWALSFTLSIATAVNALARRIAFIGYYKPLVLKWLAWFVANSVGAFFSVGMFGAIVFEILSSFGPWKGLSFPFAILCLVLPFSIIRLSVHINEDISRVHRPRRLRSTP